MGEAVLLRGRISGYRCQRGAANFFFSKNDQRALGMAAVGAALVGAVGPAMGTAIAASDMEEDADQVEFTIDGKRVSGWVWRSPFLEGDEVEVAAEKEGDKYSVVAIARPADKLIAMYPHLAKGRWAHILNALKWWFFGTGFFLILSTLFGLIVFSLNGTEIFSIRTAKIFLMVDFVVLTFMLLPTIHIALQYMPFVRAAEAVFKIMGWRNVGFIDLNKSSRVRRQGDEDPEYGTYYFRY